jgi:hypothetical protein
MYKNRIEGAAEQGERAYNREAFVVKAKWQKSRGCAEGDCSLMADPLLLRRALSNLLTKGS